MFLSFFCLIFYNNNNNKKKKKKAEEEGISLQILLNLGYLGNKNPLELNFILVAHNRYI